tara:strand:+ start:64 stop:576 length:513 start_codon:yes stop_codon:yes gene_type:complete
MLSTFNSDLFDSLIKHMFSNDLYKLLLVDKNMKQNIKKNPLDLKKNELEYELLNFSPYNRLISHKNFNTQILKENYIPYDCQHIFESKSSKFYDVNYHKIIVINDLYKNLKLDINDLCNILYILDIRLKNKSLKSKNNILRDISGYAIININKKLIIILNEIFKIISNYD